MKIELETLKFNKLFLVELWCQNCYINYPKSMDTINEKILPPHVDS